MQYDLRIDIFEHNFTIKNSLTTILDVEFISHLVLLFLLFNFGFLDNVQKPSMQLLEFDNIRLQRLQLLRSGVEVRLQRRLAHDSSLLLQPLVRFLEVLAFLLQRTQLILYLGEFDCQLLKLQVLLVVLLDDILILFTVVGQNDDGASDLVSELVEVFIALLDLLVERLVLNL